MTTLTSTRIVRSLSSLVLGTNWRVLAAFEGFMVEIKGLQAFRMQKSDLMYVNIPLASVSSRVIGYSP